MKKCSFILLFTIPLLAAAQIDVFQYGAIVLGVEQKSTSHFGMYARETTSASGHYEGENVEFLSDKGTALNMHATYYKFSDNAMESYSLDGVIYLLSYFGNMGTNHHGELGYSLAKYVTTPSVNLANVPNSVDFNRSARFWNYDLLHIKASFGKKSLNAGFNVNFKALGITGPFTWFVDKNNIYKYQNLSEVHALKTMIGPNVAYRKTIKKFSIVSLVGVNFCGNLLQSNMKVIYSPFIDVNLFFGKKLGGTVGFKYEFVKGTTQTFSSDAYKTKIVVNQLEFKVGIYFGGGKSSKKQRTLKNT